MTVTLHLLAALGLVLVAPPLAGAQVTFDRLLHAD